MSRAAGQGSLSVLPSRRTGLFALLAGVWMLLLLSLGGWWATVVLRQAQRIAELEAGDGGINAALARWSRTRLMLVGESAVFLILLLALTAALGWLYWREARRARAMQAFFASVTHELRTPLTSIRLQADAIAEGEQRETLVQRLLEDTHRLEAQIDKTLELARIEGGGPLAEQAIPLRSWLPHTLALVSEAHGERVEWQCHVAHGLPAILADAGAVQMILRNLVENSVRHAGVEPVHVELRASAQQSRVLVDYQDNGRGIARDVVRLGRLFGRGPHSSGSGVGLYLVRRLMQRMRGRVQFNTSPGNGFGVRLWFRAASAE
ncbi:MAG: HAMP domain-containing sensor histidine kinase [Steroidobacteraceae bacterium]